MVVGFICPEGKRNLKLVLLQVPMLAKAKAINIYLMPPFARTVFKLFAALGAACEMHQITYIFLPPRVFFLISPLPTFVQLCFDVLVQD